MQREGMQEVEHRILIAPVGTPHLNDRAVAQGRGGVTYRSEKCFQNTSVNGILGAD